MMKSALANLFGRTILVKSREPKTRELLSQIFASFRCNVIQSPSREAFLASIADNHLIDIAIYETQDGLEEGVEIIHGIATADLERIAVFFIANDATASVEDAYFNGADGIFSKPLHFDELAKGVAFAYAQMVDTAQRQHRRLRIRRARASVSLADVSFSGYVTNISSGGMFVTSTDALPPANQIVDFKVEYEGREKDGTPLAVSGRGVVRWLRPFREFGRPPGFGLEFTELDEGTSETLRALQDRSL